MRPSWFGGKEVPVVNDPSELEAEDGPEEPVLAQMEPAEEPAAPDNPAPEGPKVADPAAGRESPDPTKLVDGVHPFPLSQPLPPGAKYDE